MEDYIEDRFDCQCVYMCVYYSYESRSCYDLMKIKGVHLVRESGEVRKPV